MKHEIERKFLVSGDGWKGKGMAVPYRQGYIARTQDRVVRVRLAGEQGLLTIKVKTPNLLIRQEYEYEIPTDDANALLDSLAPGEIIEKIRHTFEESGFTWEVDEFLGANAGLLLAEIELESADQEFPRPDWLGQEVSRTSRYLNVQLAQNPYSNWPKAQATEAEAALK